MSKKKPCGLDYCPQEEIIGAYASCASCAWGNDSEDESEEADDEENYQSCQRKVALYKLFLERDYTLLLLYGIYSVEKKVVANERGRQ